MEEGYYLHFYDLKVEAELPEWTTLPRGNVMFMALSYKGHITLQKSAKRRVPGLVEFDPAVAYQFCLNLPGITQPRARLKLKD